MTSRGPFRSKTFYYFMISMILRQRGGFEPCGCFEVVLILAGRQQKLRQSGLSSWAIEPENTGRRLGSAGGAVRLEDVPQGSGESGDERCRQSTSPISSSCGP